MFMLYKWGLFLFIFQDLLEVVFENGKLLKDFTFDEVRKNAEIDLVQQKKGQLKL